MVSTIKTLIIFDTNSLRHALRSNRSGNITDVVYHTFEFGSPFTTLESYLKDNDLTDFIELAIPRVALDEIKRQKSRSYYSDIESFLEIHHLLSKIPYANKDKMEAPDDDFNYQSHMEQMAEKYLSEKKIRLIELPDDSHLKEVFQRIISRALNTDPPFKQHGEQSDVGFKDALIWESILSYHDIENFDKIILFTGDNGFTGCEKEFQQHFNRYFSIQKSEGDILEQLEKDYENFVENKSLMKFAKTDYFTSHLEHQLQGKSIVIDSEIYPIVSFKILDPFYSMDTLGETVNEEYEEISIDSKVKIVYAKPGGRSKLILIISTLLDETKNITDVRFDKELVD